MAIFENSPEGNQAAAQNMSDFFGPLQVDQSVRQAIQMCWMALPKDRKTAEELEKQIRRIVDRALKDFRDDAEHFGRTKPPAPPPARAS